ncbi:MAG: hypothetical protein OEM29_05215 [Thermoplasmata archaeon]|nr:hypothetical protein [Thermoplasmata archaeon]
MALRHDNRALEALPLRLLVIAVAAGLSVIPAAEALESLRDRSFLQRCEVQLDIIIGTCQMVAMEGCGAARTIPLDFRSEGRLRMASITIGDGWAEPRMTSAVLEFTSGWRMIRTATEPAVWITSADLEGLSVSSQAFSLRLTVGLQGLVTVVICEVGPWTS